MTVTRPVLSDNEVPAPVAPQATSRTMWIGFALITGVFAGATAGLLSAAGGLPVPLAILAGGGACGSAVVLVLSVVRYATGDHP